MAKDTKLSGGVIPGTDLPRHQPSEFDRLAGEHMHKAIIGTPSGDGGINPINASSPTAPANVLEIPFGMPPDKAALMQAAFAAIMAGKTVQTVNEAPNAIAAPPQHMRDAIVPDSNHRMWNPHQEFRPQAKLVPDMERSVGDANLQSDLDYESCSGRVRS